jgi:hypothetical protein
VTCLVGKNEAGKSAVLLALAALNPHPATPAVLDRERDCPRRHLTAYLQRHPDKASIAVSTTWELSPAEIDAVAREFGEALKRPPTGEGQPAKAPQVSIVRRYGAQAPEWLIDVDIRKALDHLLAAGQFSEAQLVSLRAEQDLTKIAALLETLPDLTAQQKAVMEWLKPGYAQHEERG